MNTPAILTLGQTAKLLGKSKPTISEWCANGDLPFGKNNKGHYQIQLADLQQLYPELLREQELKMSGNSKPASENLQRLTPENDTTLQAIMDAHKETVTTLRQLMDTEVQNRDSEIQRWKDEVSKANNLLADQRSDAEKAQGLLDAEKANKPIIKKRRLTLKERLFGGEIVEAEEVA